MDKRKRRYNKRPEQPKDGYTIQQLMQKTGASYNWYLKQINDGYLTATKQGKSWFVSKKAWDNFRKICTYDPVKKCTRLEQLRKEKTTNEGA